MRISCAWTGTKQPQVEAHRLATRPHNPKRPPGSRGSSWLAAGLVPANYCTRPSSPTRRHRSHDDTAHSLVHDRETTAGARRLHINTGGRRGGRGGVWDELSFREGREGGNVTQCVLCYVVWLPFCKSHQSKYTFNDE